MTYAEDIPAKICSSFAHNMTLEIERESQWPMLSRLTQKFKGLAAHCSKTRPNKYPKSAGSRAFSPQLHGLWYCD